MALADQSWYIESAFRTKEVIDPQSRGPKSSDWTWSAPTLARGAHECHQSRDRVRHEVAARSSNKGRAAGSHASELQSTASIGIATAWSPARRVQFPVGGDERVAADEEVCGFAFLVGFRLAVGEVLGGL